MALAYVIKQLPDLPRSSALPVYLWSPPAPRFCQEHPQAKVCPSCLPLDRSLLPAPASHWEHDLMEPWLLWFPPLPPHLVCLQYPGTDSFILPASTRLRPAPSTTCHWSYFLLISVVSDFPSTSRPLREVPPGSPPLGLVSSGKALRGNREGAGRVGTRLAQAL